MNPVSTVVIGSLVHVAIGVVVGVIVGFAGGYLFGRRSFAQTPTVVKILSDAFGAPQGYSNYCGSDLEAWLDNPKKKFRDDSRVLVMKVNNKNLSNLRESIRLANPQINFDPQNFLLIASVDMRNNIRESVLVQYIRLDDALEEQLGVEGRFIIDHLL